jgi:RNA polymerase sigma-70 factor (ECF subfamily)
MALEPYPEGLLEGLLDREAEPLARHGPREAIGLAFVAALQRLAPGERAVLALCDVAGFDAGEAARMLGIEAETAQRALLRARAALDARLPAPSERPPPGSPAERALLARFADAFERGDRAGLLALMSADVRLRVPPDPAEHHGRVAAARFLARVPFGRVRLVPTRANASPAFALYPREGALQGLLVLTLAGGQVADVSVFRDPRALRCFTAPAPRPR